MSDKQHSADETIEICAKMCELHAATLRASKKDAMVMAVDKVALNVAYEASIAMAEECAGGIRLLKSAAGLAETKMLIERLKR